jgi:hypothetical protein
LNKNNRARQRRKDAPKRNAVVCADARLTAIHMGFHGLASSALPAGIPDSKMQNFFALHAREAARATERKKLQGGTK